MIKSSAVCSSVSAHVPVTRAMATPFSVIFSIAMLFPPVLFEYAFCSKACRQPLPQSLQLLWRVEIVARFGACQQPAAVLPGKTGGDIWLTQLVPSAAQNGGGRVPAAHGMFFHIAVVIPVQRFSGGCFYGPFPAPGAPVLRRTSHHVFNEPPAYPRQGKGTAPVPAARPRRLPG